MTWWLTSHDGELSYFTRTARTAEEACAQLAAKYECETFTEFCRKADYDPASFRIAELIDERRPAVEGEMILGPPPGLLTQAWLAVRAALS